LREQRKRLIAWEFRAFASSVLNWTAESGTYANAWERIADENKTELELCDYYGEFYIPGFHVHPGYVKESVSEIRRMHALGVKLIGELCPYQYE
jgi:hypothetical protein